MPPIVSVTSVSYVDSGGVQPMAAAASAGWYWQTNNLNRFADSGDFKALSIAINGRNKATGLPNGWGDRLNIWARAKAALGVTARAKRRLSVIAKGCSMASSGFAQVATRARADLEFTSFP